MHDALTQSRTLSRTSRFLLLHLHGRLCKLLVTRRSVRPDQGSTHRRVYIIWLHSSSSVDYALVILERFRLQCTLFFAVTEPPHMQRPILVPMDYLLDLPF